MFKWLNKNLRPSQKIAAISDAVVKRFSEGWSIKIEAKIDIVPKDSDGDGVPDIDEVCEKG